MSRSKRKNPIFGITTAVSEASDKAHWHRRHRRVERSELKAEAENHEPRSHREHSDPWLMDKDGKRYWAPGLRTDLMRK
jgi:hypothetical protein